MVASLDRKRLGAGSWVEQGTRSKAFSIRRQEEALAFAADAVCYGIGTPLATKSRVGRYLANIVDGKVQF
jgi:hypothetical protein